jgi:hypothetical protein
MNQNGHKDAYIVETTDDEGQVHLFEKVDEFELEGQQYALLIYLGSGDEEEEGKEEGYDEEIVVMRVSRDTDGEVYEAIEDEAEFERVVQFIEEMDEEEEDEE